MSVWEVHVYRPTGARRAVLTPEDAVATLRWAKRGDGDCLEAQITGVRLPITARDVIAIVTRETPEDAASSRVRFWGWCVQAGNPRSPRVSEWRFVGGSQRLREVTNRNPGFGGGDVAVAAREALLESLSSAPQARVGLVPHLGPQDDGRFPLLGLEAGVRETRLETIADSLDALAELAPAFIAPAEGYSFDGRLYEEGELVPAVTWGVTAGQAAAPESIAYDPATGTAGGGLVFFKRVDGTLALDELTDRLTVEWDPVTAEGVVDSVVAAIATAPTSGVSLYRAAAIATAPLEPVAHEVRDAFGLGLDAWRVVEAPDLDTLEPAAWLAAPLSAFINNRGNAFDGDPATFASNDEVSMGLQPIEAPAVVLLFREAEPATRAVRVRYASFTDLEATIRFGDPVLGGSPHAIATWRLASTNGEQKEVWLVAPRPRGASSTVRVGVLYNNPPAGTYEPGQAPTLVADSFRIYVIEALKPNVDVLDRIARSQLTPLPDPGATVQVPNRIVEPQPRVTLTLATGESVEAKLGAAEYAVTAAGGLSTLLRLEDELPPELQAERDLLEKRAPRREQRRGAMGGRL